MVTADTLRRFGPLMPDPVATKEATRPVLKLVLTASNE